MIHDIPEQIREEIENLISSDSSPVGIDAKQTHIVIIYKLLQIEARLKALEEKAG